MSARPGMRARRLALGLDQEDLAAVLGVKQVMVSRWETGERDIPLGVFRELDALEGAQDTLEELCLAGEDEPVAYVTEEEFWAEQPSLRGVPLAVQHVAVARATRRRAAKPKQGDMELSPVQVQLVEELVTAADRWKALVGVEVSAAVVEAVQGSADVLARALTHEQSRSVAEAVMAVLWGSGEPPSGWWRSPLGRALGAALPDAPITHQTAADILGVKRGTVSVLVRRGDLGVVVQPRRGGPGRPTQMHQISRHAVLERVAQRERHGGEG